MLSTYNSHPISVINTIAKMLIAQRVKKGHW